MRKRVIHYLPRASKVLRRDFKKPRTPRLKNIYLRNNFFYTITVFLFAGILYRGQTTLKMVWKEDHKMTNYSALRNANVFCDIVLAVTDFVTYGIIIDTAGTSHL